MMSEISVKSLHVYPVKSLGGQDLSAAEVKYSGFKYDRNWVLVDPSGMALTQRQIPTLALLKASISDGQLIVQRKDSTADSISIPIDEMNNDTLNVSIWRDSVQASSVATRMNQWFSDHLQMEVRLVKPVNANSRKKYIHKEKKAFPIQFSDGYPYLILSQASVDTLNDKSQINYLVNRFRANIVLENCPAHFEDGLDLFEIGGLTFRMAKKCQRCTLINTNQETGERSSDLLKALATYRTIRNGIYFGVNAIALEEGTIRKGDKIKKVANPI